MSAMALPGTPLIGLPVFGRIRADRTLAIGLTLGLHIFLGAMLLVNWHTQETKLVPLNSIKVSMIALPAAATDTMKVVPASAPPLQKQVTPVPPEAPAELARKRVEKKPEEKPREIVPKPTVPDHAEQQRNEEMLRQAARRDAEARQADEQRQRDAHAEGARQEAARQAASRQYLPIDKRAPAYPQRALDQGLEGTCTVSYTVNTAGRVEQPQVAGECHPLFIRPSLEAAKGFRYEPRIVDGKAVVVPNVKNTFQYRIEQQAAASAN
jgi:protein TonB